MQQAKFPLGYRTGSNTVFNIVIPENTADAKTNMFMLGKQGIGKTNLISLMAFHMINAHRKTRGKFGCIPIIFAPTFEYTKLEEKSTAKGMLPPKTEAQGIEITSLSFKMANVPEDLKEKITIVKLEFTELTTEDIAVFCGFGGDSEALGKIEKYIEELKTQYGNNYGIENFLEIAKAEKGAPFNSIYYVFKGLKENGLFDDTLETFDWETVLKKEKPVCFHFGDIDDEPTYQALAGILLRKLFALSNKYLNAVYKRIRLQNLGKTNWKEDLTDDENWFLEKFVIGLIFEEAHQFFPPTTTKVLRSFPAHKYFKLISMALGRKRNFKFNFLVSQRLELLYKEFRTEFDELFTGSKVDATDKGALYEIFRQIISNTNDARQLVTAICGNKKFEFTMTDLNQLNRVMTMIQRGDSLAGEDPPITKFKAYIAPCGIY